MLLFSRVEIGNKKSFLRITQSQLYKKVEVRITSERIEHDLWDEVLYTVEVISKTGLFSAYVWKTSGYKLDPLLEEVKEFFHTEKHPPQYIGIVK